MLNQIFESTYTFSKLIAPSPLESLIKIYGEQETLEVLENAFSHSIALKV